MMNWLSQSSSLNYSIPRPNGKIRPQGILWSCIILNVVACASLSIRSQLKSVSKVLYLARKVEDETASEKFKIS